MTIIQLRNFRNSIKYHFSDRKVCDISNPDGKVSVEEAVNCFLETDMPFDKTCDKELSQWISKSAVAKLNKLIKKA